MAKACPQPISIPALHTTAQSHPISNAKPASVAVEFAWIGSESVRRPHYAAQRDPAPELETEALLAYLAQGDSSAFWRLWSRHQKYLYGLCLRQMGGVQEDAEDALSRAMLKAWDKLPGYAATITDLRAWLARLISNLCVDIHRERRRRTRSTVSLEEMVAADKEPAPPSQRSPEDALLSRELLGHVMTVVDELPARLREPFVLRFMQETPYREIAERLTLTGDNTRKRVQQARAIVRECLHGYLSRPEAALGRRATSLQSTHLVE